MSEYYIAGCVFTSQFPDLSLRIQEYVTRRFEMTVWVPGHETLIPELLKHLNPGGVFAAQFPMNDAEPIYQIIRDMAEEERWNFKNVEVDYNGYLTPREYFNLLTGHCNNFQMWETKK